MSALNTSASATIVATATALPPHRASQDEVKAAYQRLFPMEPRRLAAVLTSIFDNAHVEHRYSVLPLDEVDRRRSLTETMAAYKQHALPLAREVTRTVLARAKLNPDQIDLFIMVSCTGVVIPSLDAHLVDELGFRRDVRRLPITELGCAAGAAGLARAHDFLRGFPDANVLVVAVELPSLNLQLDDLSRDNLVSSALFGDGAAAVVMRGGAHAGVRVLDTTSHLFPRSTHALGFDLRSDGFHCVLSKDIPGLLRAQIADVVAGLIARSGLTREQLTCFVVHPGGKTILGSFEEALGLPRTAIQPSWDVLRDFGNQSSASVLFVLHHWLETGRAPSGAHGLLVGFGPGLSADMLLLQWT
jgi:alkylresorcinol/alkylpyrone synthase